MIAQIKRMFTLAGNLLLVSKPCRANNSVWPDMDIEIKAWQVMELEESRKCLLQENQRLTESMSGLQSQIQNLENRITSACMSPLGAMVRFLCPMHILDGSYYIMLFWCISRRSLMRVLNNIFDSRE